MLFSGSQALTFSVANRMSHCPKAPTGHTVNWTKGTPPQLLHPEPCGLSPEADVSLQRTLAKKRNKLEPES